MYKTLISTFPDKRCILYIIKKQQKTRYTGGKAIQNGKSVSFHIPQNVSAGVYDSSYYCIFLHMNMVTVVNP